MVAIVAYLIRLLDLGIIKRTNRRMQRDPNRHSSQTNGMCCSEPQFRQAKKTVYWAETSEVRRLRQSQKIELVKFKRAKVIRLRQTIEKF